MATQTSFSRQIQLAEDLKKYLENLIMVYYFFKFHLYVFIKNNNKLTLVSLFFSKLFNRKDAKFLRYRRKEVYTNFFEII